MDRLLTIVLFVIFSYLIYCAFSKNAKLYQDKDIINSEKYNKILTVYLIIGGIIGIISTVLEFFGFSIYLYATAYTITLLIAISFYFVRKKFLRKG